MRAFGRLRGVRPWFETRAKVRAPHHEDDACGYERRRRAPRHEEAKRGSRAVNANAVFHVKQWSTSICLVRRKRAPLWTSEFVVRVSFGFDLIRSGPPPGPSHCGSRSVLLILRSVAQRRVSKDAPRRRCCLRRSFDPANRSAKRVTSSGANGEARLDSDRDRALTLTPVSRETASRLDRFVALLLTWQKTTQLVASSTIPNLWTRHVADSLQLIDIVPSAKVWVDMGAGAGFPGLVIACALGETLGAQVHLVESNARKAAFLRAAVAATESPATVHAVRMEKFVESFAARVDVVTARAVSPLSLLLEQCLPLLSRGAVGIYPKGQDVEAELTEASKYWKMTTDLVPSRTEPKARIVIIRALEPREPAR
jgi:16S rRNA (guanine527-N7)-methyltransferase